MVFTSSIASFSGGQDGLLPDDTRQIPANSYGTQKAAAEKAVRRIKGVLGIAQDIEVRLQGADSCSDEDICRRAVIALAFDALLPADAVMVTVSNGWITLTGELDWQFERNAAEVDVAKLRGVVGVTNGVSLKPRVERSDIADRIRAILAREAEVEARSVAIVVDGDRDVLEGEVRSWRDRELVERAAWAAPGVRSVDDRLRIA